MFNFFCKILQHPKINPGSAPDKYTYEDIVYLCKFWRRSLNDHLTSKKGENNASNP